MSLDAKSIEQFDAVTQGKVLTSKDAEYNEARKIWNGMFDKRPAIISRCKSAQDVAESVKFANKNKLLIAIKSGGHNSAGTASCDDGMMIDLSLMDNVEVDPDAKTVSAEGGCLLSKVDAVAQVYGLAVPAGVVSHTGVGGLALGGGFGWISRKFGFSIDNLLSAEVVTADGNIVHASKDENPELFWGIRGGGGNFGIVTKFTFRGNYIGNEVYSGLIIKRFEDAREYLKFHRDYVRTMPDEMTFWLIIRHAPPLPFLPEEHHGKMVVVVAFVYLGDPAKGEALAKPVRDFGTTLGEGIGMNPWTGWQSAFDALNSHGARNYWKSHNLSGLPDQAIDVILDYASKMPTADCEVFIPHMEGAPSRVATDATAYSFRDPPFVMNVHTRWNDPEDDARCMKWASELFEDTRPFSHGVYVNFLSDMDTTRAMEAYSKENWLRLKKVKQQWDPENRFRMNMNIPPNGN